LMITWQRSGPNDVYSMGSGLQIPEIGGQRGVRSCITTKLVWKEVRTIFVVLVVLPLAAFCWRARRRSAKGKP
jgi:hypothetical protein